MDVGVAEEIDNTEWRAAGQHTLTRAVRSVGASVYGSCAFIFLEHQQLNRKYNCCVTRDIKHMIDGLD